MASPQPAGNRVPERRDYRKEVTESIIQMLEQGVAPWQKPWDAATVGNLAVPFNPTSNNPYRGGNASRARNAVLRFERARPIVNTGVNDAAVKPGLVLGPGGFLLKHRDAKAGKTADGLESRGEADNPRADHRKVEFAGHSLIIST
jgi:hypothetical protein